MWSLWKSQNIKLWELSETTAVVTISRAKDTLHEWSCMQKEKPQVQKTEYPLTWVKPPSGVLKCNVDAAIFQSNSIAGYGLCFRNSMGQFLLGKSAFSTSSGSVFEAEAVALLGALDLAVSHGFQVVQFETDNKILADAIHNNSVHLNEFGDIISQCRNILSTNP